METCHILWTTTDKEVVINMLAMYATNSRIKGWWAGVNVIIWGPSARMIGEDAEMQGVVTDMMANGVHVEACKACADRYGTSDLLTSLGVEVKYMGMPLTAYLKGGEPLITL